MKILTRKIFEKLANVREHYCISIYIPTHRTGENQDSLLHFKNEIQSIENELVQLGLKEQEIKKYMSDCEDLFEDSRFWRNLDSGLAVFINGDNLWYFTTPYRFENFSMVSDHFYLLNLIPVFNENGQYFLLKLSLNNVQLYKASRNSIFEIPLEKEIPQSLEDAVGYDYEQKSLQFRTGLNQGNQGIFHGHGSGSDDKKIETEKYFNELNKYLSAIFSGYDIPLVLAATGNNYHMFKEVNSYPHLFEKFISGSPDDANLSQLHQESWELIKNHFTRDKEERMKQYELMKSKDRASSDINEIIPAAIHGNVDTLFIKKHAQVWGTYSEKNNRVNINRSRKTGDSCLLNKAGLAVFLQKGNVYLTGNNELPAGTDETLASAILRF